MLSFVSFKFQRLAKERRISDARIPSRALTKPVAHLGRIFGIFFILMVAFFSVGCANDLILKKETALDLMYSPSVRLYDLSLMMERVPLDDERLIFVVNRMVLGELVWIDHLKIYFMRPDAKKFRALTCRSIDGILGRGLSGGYDEANVFLAREVKDDLCSD